MFINKWMEYYAALKKKKLLSHAVWNLKTRDKYFMIPLILSIQSRQNHRNRKLKGDCQGLEEERVLLFNGHRTLVLQDEKVLGIYAQ